MERRVIPESENRLVILYAMGVLGPVTGAQLLQFMVELDLMNYITLQLSMGELEEQGQILRRAHPGDALWDMTPEGRFTLESFGRRIPQSRRKRMDREAGGYRARFRQEQLATAESFTLPDGTACMRLRLQEERSSLMELTLHVPAGQVPTTLEDRWRRCAQTVYEAVIAALTEGYAPDAPLPPTSEDTVRQVGEGEWLLMLSSGPDQPEIALLMPMPGEHLARWCAARWPEAGEALRRQVIRQLEEADGSLSPAEEVSDKGE